MKFTIGDKVMVKGVVNGNIRYNQSSNLIRVKTKSGDSLVVYEHDLTRDAAIDKDVIEALQQLGAAIYQKCDETLNSKFDKLCNELRVSITHNTIAKKCTYVDGMCVWSRELDNNEWQTL